MYRSTKLCEFLVAALLLLLGGLLLASCTGHVEHDCSGGMGLGGTWSGTWTSNQTSGQITLFVGQDSDFCTFSVAGFNENPTALWHSMALTGVVTVVGQATAMGELWRETGAEPELVGTVGATLAYLGDNLTLSLSFSANQVSVTETGVLNRQPLPP